MFVLSGLLLKKQGISGTQSWAAATVVWMAVWWITEPVPLWATACLPLVCFPIFSGVRLDGVLVQYFDPVNFLFLGGMWIAACMEQWGLHRRIALGIVSAIGVSPRRIVLGFMLATGFMTMWISNTAAAMMMFPIAMAVLHKFEEQQGRDDLLLQRFGLALMLGIAYAASIGGIGTKIGTGTNLVFVKASQKFLPQGIDFLSWVMIGVPLVIITLPLVWLYLIHFGARVPSENFPGGAQTIRDERAKLGAMKPGEKVALAAFLAAGSLWITRKDLDFGRVVIPGWSRLIPWNWADVLPLNTWPEHIQKLFTETGDAMVAMVIASILLFCPLRRQDGSGQMTRALNWRNAAQVQWGMLVLLGGGFAMAYGIQTSGLSKTIQATVSQFGRMEPFALILTVSFIAMSLTQVASNTATASILIPIAGAAAPDLGMHPAPVMLAITMASSFGFMLPAGTPPNAIVYSSGYITVPQMARSGLIVDLFGATIVAFTCYYLAPLVLGLSAATK
jgi:solute carrier family 13 (sodium-dependent dicarboxylate transporter), member 2/3/5